MLSMWSTCSIQPQFRFMKCHYVNPIWSHVNGSSTSSSNGGGWVELPPPKKKTKTNEYPLKIPMIGRWHVLLKWPLFGGHTNFLGSKLLLKWDSPLTANRRISEALTPPKFKTAKSLWKMVVGGQACPFRKVNFSGSKLYSCRECTIQVHRCSTQVPMHVSQLLHDGLSQEIPGILKCRFTIDWLWFPKSNVRWNKCHLRILYYHGSFWSTKIS